jgi:hypothetical protein
MIYAEAFTDEKLPNFVAGTVHALGYYGAILLSNQHEE